VFFLRNPLIYLSSCDFSLSGHMLIELTNIVLFLLPTKLN
jgi:hypothetical protein